MAENKPPQSPGTMPAYLEGPSLMIAGLLLAMSNFIVVLDMTIANVSVPHIAGGLAISPNEGTYVITSYAVAEAICVPLTGFLAARFGNLKVFTTCIFLFGLCSLLCGLSSSLGMLVVSRVLQGFSGGPLMPLTQTLMMRVFPPKKRAGAMGLWAMTTLLAPVMGPIIGGYISDNWGWPYIFFINIPLTIICGVCVWTALKSYETKTVKNKIDFVGLGLLIVWVSSLQIMLDKGKDLDWFGSPVICGLAVAAAIGFISFLIWELTEENPIVDLKVFRHRGFSASVLTISLAFGAYFSSVVLTPLWLQTYMGYTATWSGVTVSYLGMLAILIAPLVGKFSSKFDPRYLVFGGVMWIALWTFIRSFGTTDMTHWQVSWPMLFQGMGTPFFFIPLTALALASVNETETASAAGLMNFLRTLSGAFATSIVTTSWDNDAVRFRSDIVARVTPPPEMAADIARSIPGLPTQAHVMFDQMVQGQAIMMATNHIFQVSSCTFILAACAIWLAPKPTRKADTSAAH